MDSRDRDRRLLPELDCQQSRRFRSNWQVSEGSTIVSFFTGGILHATNSPSHKTYSVTREFNPRRRSRASLHQTCHPSQRAVGLLRSLLSCHFFHQEIEHG
jgi:hypothetical protein